MVCDNGNCYRCFSGDNRCRSKPKLFYSHHELIAGIPAEHT